MAATLSTTTIIFLLISLILLSFPFSGFSNPVSDELPILFNFGDSNSDTGSYSATWRYLTLPYGTTYFNRSSGRASDGRLIVDFIAEKLGIPHLSAYLNSIRPDFRHGANFASAGATIQPATGTLFEALYNPITISNVQVSQFQQFKNRTIELYNRDRDLWGESYLPRPEDFSKALYTLDCGQNDIDSGLKIMADEQEVIESLPYVISKFSLSVKTLYEEGARKFWVHNTGPIGCLPVNVKLHPPNATNADSIGCIKSYNSVAKEFNKLLNQTVAELRTELKDAVIVLVDMYFAKYSLIGEAKKYGFEDPLDCCCGHFADDYILNCATTTTLSNGTELYGDNICKDLSKHVNFDCTHYTEAANKLLASRVVEGYLSDPPLSILEVLSSNVTDGKFIEMLKNKEIEEVVNSLKHRFLHRRNGPISLHV